jgi:glycosyltransferase involved in cell wall biosynthesis
MVSHNLELEGAPNSQYELTIGLKRNGILDPIVFSPQDGPLRALYENSGINVSIIGPILDPIQNFRNLDKNVNRFAVTLDRIRPDLLYANTLQTFWAIEASSRAGFPSIWNIRESEPPENYFEFLPAKHRPLAYGCFRHPWKIVFVANATMKNWECCTTADRTIAIHNGLDTERFMGRLSKISRTIARKTLGCEESDIVFLLVGTVSERKGQIDAIKAFYKLTSDARQSIKIFIVGDRPRDPYSARLHVELQQISSPDRDSIRLVQETADIHSYYRAADVALCTSRVESYPRVILEAMASGLPIITTPVFGICEQVVEGVNGIFYEPGNDSQLAAAMQILIENHALRQEMAKKSFDVFCSLTTYSQMLQEYAQIFVRAAKSARSTTGDARIRRVFRHVRDRWLYW